MISGWLGLWSNFKKINMVTESEGVPESIMSTMASNSPYHKHAQTSFELRAQWYIMNIKCNGDSILISPLPNTLTST